MPSIWRRTSLDIAASRAGHAAVVLDQRIYLIGGRKGRTFHGDVLVVDIRAGTCEPLQGLKGSESFAPRAGHTAVPVGREIWVLGGSNNECIFSDVAVLDVDKRVWRFPTIK